MNFQLPTIRLTRLLRFLFISGLFSAQTLLAQNIKILINHLGYEKDAPKRAVILGHAGDDVTAFKVLDAESGTGNVLRQHPQNRPGGSYGRIGFFGLRISAA